MQSHTLTGRIRQTIGLCFLHLFLLSSPLKVAGHHWDPLYNFGWPVLRNARFGTSTDNTIQMWSRSNNLQENVTWKCGYRPAMQGMDDRDATLRIVGGQEAQSGQFPWQAQLYMTRTTGKSEDDDQVGDNDSTTDETESWTVPLSRMTFLCGATLITDRVILTAAHCLKSDDGARYQVVLGSHHRFESSLAGCCKTQRLAVRKFLKHAKFNPHHLLYDVAIVWIYAKYSQRQQGVYLSKYVQPICLPPPIEGQTTSFYSTGMLGTASGWGLTDENDKNSASKKLRYVTVPVVDRGKCEKIYDKIVKYDSEVQFCAGNDAGQDACAGDSGGPYVTASVNGTYVLIGIVSYGVGCGRSKYPGVYVKVDAFSAWIKEQIDQDLNSTDRAVAQVHFGSSTPTELQSESTTKSVTTSTISPLPNARQIGPVCKGAFRFVSCPRGTGIDIASVFFGSQDTSICSQPAKLSQQFDMSGDAAIPCSSTSALGRVQNKCQKKRACWVYHALFAADASPCHASVSVYLTVHYTCH